MEDIDLFAGMFTEETEFSDSLYGRTFVCLITDQFARLKLGDRYFYDLKKEINPGAFELEQGNHLTNCPTCESDLHNLETNYRWS